MIYYSYWAIRKTIGRPKFIMELTIIFSVILFISFLLGLRSMKDFDGGQEVRRFVRKKKKGTIVFFKDKVKHYSS